MVNLGFKNARDPIVYVLDQELRKRNLKNKLQMQNCDLWDGSLVEYPVQLIRDSSNKVIKCIYGVGEQQWSEELIRDSSNKVYEILVTYPDSSQHTIHIHRTGKLVDFVSET